MRFFKKRKSFLVLALAVPALLLAGACGASAPAPGEPSAAAETEPAEVGTESVVAVSFVNDAMIPETIQVKQGDKVTLNLETDRPGSFHIHGYDLQREAVVGEVTQFQFVANATGRFRMNFHGVAEPTGGMAAGPEQGGNVAEASMVEMNKAGDDPGKSEMSAGTTKEHGDMEHGPTESAVSVSVDIAAEVDGDGGVHVAIDTEGWRWAPEEVNQVNSDGAGHAHIYADGVKLSRVYGNYHYIPALEPGTREIRVNLNSNDHSELTWQGELLESSVMATIPEITSMRQQDTAPTMASVEAEAPMSLRVNVHEDLLGGYNLEVVPSGFEFPQSEGQGHELGMGYAQLSIDGEVFNRLYVPWLQVPARGEGMHTFTVSLLNNEGQPYQYNGQPVAMSVTVNEEAKPEDGYGASAGHHDAGSPQKATGGHHDSGPDAAAASDHHGGAGGSADHHGGGVGATAGIVELEVGYLEVLP